METNYFLKTDVSQWSVRTAFQEQEQERPSLNVRQILQNLKGGIKKATESEQPERASAAQKLLDDWETIKSSLTQKRNKKKQKAKYSNVNYGGVLIAQPKGAVTVTHHEDPVPSKKRKSQEEGNSSTRWSWDSSEKNKRRKYLNVYISSSYGNTDFGGDDDNSPKWMIKDMNMTEVLREYRQKSVEGAQMRRNLSDARILSLSYIFLLSPTQRCVMSRLSLAEKNSLVKTLNVKEYLELVDDEVILACRKVQVLMTDDEKSDNEIEEAIHVVVF
ncbi:hypothetical protein DFQ28_007752 [Apophysomyces sp. BC1034]|nr:hypothetical protein DFQ30_007634 [Apophysomyces sp. BC1015]KAG0176083.1 hypothetical protein DFQ29_006603 [Apophysomyces sp. BC1021]KAG0186463.1 hypothetical protein DFQ28_007752 [Apophysomyces sp. BC1034]